MRELQPGQTRGFTRGKATRAFTEARVVNEIGVVWNTMPLEVTLTVILTEEQFICMPRR